MVLQPLGPRRPPTSAPPFPWACKYNGRCRRQTEFIWPYAPHVPPTKSAACIPSSTRCPRIASITKLPCFLSLLSPLLARTVDRHISLSIPAVLSTITLRCCRHDRPSVHERRPTGLELSGARKDGMCEWIATDRPTTMWSPDAKRKEGKRIFVFGSALVQAIHQFRSRRQPPASPSLGSHQICTAGL